MFPTNRYKSDWLEKLAYRWTDGPRNFWETWIPLTYFQVVKQYVFNQTPAWGKYKNGKASNIIYLIPLRSFLLLLSKCRNN